MSATCAATFESVLPVVRLHSDTKAVRLLLVSVIRLKGAFHVVGPKSKWDYTIGWIVDCEPSSELHTTTETL
jgi:hypothetical protein